MAQVGIVKTLEGGVFYAKDSSGNIRELSIGDSISENEVVYGDSSNQTSAKVEMELSGNDIIVLNQAQQQLIDSSLNQVTFGNEEVIFSKGDINTTFENADLSAWNNTTDDVSDDMETAAGDPTQQETQAGEEEPTEEGRVTARFSARDGSSTDVRSDLRDTIDFGTQLSESDNDDEIAAELLNPQTTTTEPTTPTIPVDTRVEASKITLSNPTVDEGKDITITATVDNAPQTDLVITLNNGEKITIKAGETSGSITFTNPNTEDVYKDSSTETYTITGTTGGNYKDLDIADKSTVTIVDTVDVTKITLTGSEVIEGGQITITASVDNKVTGEDLVITLDNGKTITIPVGETTGKVEYDSRADDAYKQGTDSQTVKISGTTGGNFEALDTTSTTTVVVKDDSDVTKITLTGSEVIEGGQITITASVDNKVTGEDLVITLDNGKTITIPVGETTGKVEYDSRADDAYKQGTDSQTVKISGTTGGNFEALDTTSTTTVVVKDDSDVTKITLTGSEVIEGGQITITASVDNKVTGEDLVITLDNGKTITIPVGETTGKVEYDSRADDAYKQGTDSQTVKISGTTGGNFEALDTTSTTTVVVKDDSDVTKITLTGSEVIEGGQITITASVDNKVTGEDLVITLDNGKTITIPVGETTGKVEYDSRADDAYKQGTDSQTVKISGTTGGNFEALDTTSTTTVVVKDDSDVTKITLTGSEVIEGGQITITASVDNKVTGEDLVITLDNGKTITIPVGETTGKVEYDSRADDAYKQGTDSQTVKISGTTGGNFEALDTTSTTTVVVKDDSDVTKITLTGSEVIEGGQITITASVDNKVTGEDLVITLDNGKTITIPVGETTGKVEYDSRADDAYKQGTDSQTVKISGTTGGNFEALDTTSTTTVVVKDDSDVTKITLTGSEVIEGGQITITASVDNKVTGEDLVITLDNGKTITIPVGETTGKVEYDSRADDAYKQGTDSQTVKISGTTGGNFEALDTTSTTTVVVKDDSDVTKITLTGSEVIEGGQITITASVDNKVTGEDLVITLDNGKTITIPVGETTGKVEYDSRADDAYKQGTDSQTVKISGTTGGNFEALDTTSTTTVVVKDDSDVTKITLTGSEVIEGGQITITASVDNKVTGEDLVITLDNGKTITIPVGETTGKVEYDSRADDAYKQGTDSQTVKISGTTGGNFEALDTTSTTTVVVKDDSDVTKITLTGSEVIEGGQITITASVDNKVTGEDLVITLDNGKTITIPVGETTGKVEYDSRADDAYKQGTDSQTVKISGTTGGNFEALDTTSTTTVVVKDDSDVTKITLTGSEVIEGGQITITASVDNKVTGEDLVITLDNGKTITIPVGETTGKVEYDSRADDAYKQGTDSQTVKISGTTGGNFEALDTTSTTTVVVKDDSDVTKITLTGSEVIEGGQITITASVDNKVTGEDLVITLDNGKTITIPVGETTGKVEYDSRADDAYKQGTDSQTVKISGTTGGNFEALDTTSTTTVVVKDDSDVTKITLTGSEVIEGGQITITASVDNKVTGEDLVITLDNGKTITIPVGETTGKVEYDSRADDAYKQGTDSQTVKISGTTGGNFEALDTTSTTTVVVKDDSDVTTVTITAVETTEKVITIDNLQNNQGFTVTAKDPYGNTAKISTHTGPAGFGVESIAETNSGKLGQTDAVYSGHTSEIGVVKDAKTGKYLSESIEVEFKNPIQTLDVAFAWRHNGETAKVDFYNGNQKVGYAIVSGGGSDTQAVVQYYDKDGKLKETVKTQGGTDNVDLVYTFKPAGDVTFTKAVFSADGAGSDYLIHSIKYKEVVGEDSTTIVGSSEVAFKIETSNIPDPTKYDFKTTFPTAYVKIVDGSNNLVFEGNVNLDANGKAIVTVRTDGTKDLTATVSDVQGNFEKVDYSDASTTIVSSLSPQAGNDSITILEDTSYTLKSTDFGDNNQNVAKIKFNELPENGKIYVLKSEYTGSMNDRAEYTSSENKIYVEIKVTDVVDISQINKGNVIFVPNKDTDDNGSFKFGVSNGNGNFSGNYTTDIIVKAVADAPTASIDVTKVGETTISTGNNGNTNTGSNEKITKLNFETYKYAEQSSIGTQINGDKEYKDAKDSSDTLIFNNNLNNSKIVNTGKGDDKVYFSQQSSVNLDLGDGNNEAHFNAGMSGSIKAGSGNDEIRINQSSDNIDINLGNGKNDLYIQNFNSGKIEAGSGADNLVVNQSAKGNINLGDGDNSISIKDNFEGSITTGSGNDRIIIGGNINGQGVINTGEGNDFVQIHGEINNNLKLNFGEGDDGLRYELQNWNAGNQNAIDGGKGFDTLYLKGNSTDYKVYTKDSSIVGATFWKNYNGENLYTVSWENFAKANEDSEGFTQKVFYIMQNNTEDANRALKVTNFESVSFDDKTFGTKEEKISADEYKVDIGASLTDRDGSETLSVIIKNVPASATLESSKYEVSKNSDGSYTVKIPAGIKDISDSLTMKVPQSYKGDINLQIEAKSTETRDNEDGQNFKIATDSDAVVTTVDETSNITVNKGEKTNLVLTVDVSGSMAVYGNGAIIDKEKGITRLDVVKQSLISTIETYKAAGDTMVNITLFANGASNKGWMSADNAMKYINSLSMDKNFNIYEGTSKIALKASSTDYSKALEETGKVNISGSGQADAKTVGYFISDGQPQTNSQQKAVDSDTDTAIVNWKKFIDKNNIDLKVIGVGTAEDNADALKYLKSVQVMSHDEVIVINEPSSIETVMLSTVEGTVFGDVTDNFSGGDGKVTIDSIEIGNKIYTKDTMPIGGVKLDGEGKLLFDFTTGKYAYNGNGIDIKEDSTKSFKVNVSDEDGDKDSINVNFELNKDQIKDGIINFNEDGDINFSNLKNITEINLDNGKENKLSLTLDDVLKLSSDDNTIKISGDKFDSVTFKDTIGDDGKENAWSKTEGTGTDKGYDIYMNSGDPTVQVKVEQPISDGITN